MVGGDGVMPPTDVPSNKIPTTESKLSHFSKKTDSDFGGSKNRAASNRMKG